MIHTLKCPSCGAPLDYDDGVESDSVRCPFCANRVMLPARPGGQPQVVIRHSFTRGARRGSSGSPTVALIIVAVTLVFAGGLVFFIVRTVNRTISRATSQPERPRVSFTTPPMPPLPPKANPHGYAEPDMEFGSEGIGPGNFKDARSIAVDAEGRIYVGEYIGGRVQVFDPAGKFITQWMVDQKMPLRGLASDRRGTVYVVQRGEIMRYEGLTGKPLGKVAYSGRAGFDDVAVTPDGGLVTFSQEMRDDIIRFDSSGQVTKVIRSAISGQTDRSELNMRVACDGLGNIYALGTFNNAVFKFSPEGRFITQFGGDGDEPGQFRAPGAIAVDNQGRVYVDDFHGVQVFDSNGRFLRRMKIKGASFGMTFNDRNELFIAARTQVLKFNADK